MGREKYSPKMSVVVPCFNKEATIKSCIEGILKQDYPLFELIVVDDGSSDNSYKIITSFKAAKIVKNKKNRGAAAARNAGAMCAKGDIIVFTDADSVIEKDSLRKISTLFKKEINTVAIVGLQLPPKIESSLATEHFISRLRFNFLGMPEYIETIYGSLFAIRKKTFIENNGFDEVFRGASIEDAEFGLRLARKGHKIRLMKGLGYHHLKNISSAGLLANDFTRAADRAKFLFRERLFRRVFEKRRFISTPFNTILAAVCSPLIFGAFFSYFFWYAGVFVLASLLVIFLILNAQYFFFISTRRGLLLLAGLYFFLIFDYLFIVLGIIYGILGYALGEKY